MYFHLSYSSNVIIQQKITWVWVGCSPQEVGGGSVCCSGAELAVQSFSWWHLGTMGLLVSVCWLLIPAWGSCLRLTFSWIIYSDVLLLLLLLGFFGFFFLRRASILSFLLCWHTVTESLWNCSSCLVSYSAASKFESSIKRSWNFRPLRWNIKPNRTTTESVHKVRSCQLGELKEFCLRMNFRIKAMSLFFLCSLHVFGFLFACWLPDILICKWNWDVSASAM